MKRFNFPESVPLRYDDHGTIRVIGSRVTLDGLVFRFQEGDTLEEIHDGFPSVTVEQINTIISWYLNNRTQVDEYIREEDLEAEKILKRLESQPGSMDLREKIRSLREQLIKT